MKMKILSHFIKICGCSVCQCALIELPLKTTYLFSNKLDHILMLFVHDCCSKSQMSPLKGYKYLMPVLQTTDLITITTACFMII